MLLGELVALAFKIALIQLLVGADKASNVKKAVSKVVEAAKNGANVIVLPVSSLRWCFVITLAKPV